jgi:hypothetical protein
MQIQRIYLLMMMIMIIPPLSVLHLCSFSTLCVNKCFRLFIYSL